MNWLKKIKYKQIRSEYNSTKVLFEKLPPASINYEY